MELRKNLVLSRYFFNLFGFEDFNAFRNSFGKIRENQHYSAAAWVNQIISKSTYLQLDKIQISGFGAAIDKYIAMLQKHRPIQELRLKYFQILAVLFSEIYLEKLFNNPAAFLKELNDYLHIFNKTNHTAISLFRAQDIKKIAFWMATGSGKTLIMHINYWQILKHSTVPWDNILLITPNEGLSQQHYRELQLSGIPAKLYDGNPNNLLTGRDQILVIDIHKLNEQKKGKGVRVDISYFDGKNLVFIDEGHKGQMSEEQRWKKLREALADHGMILEYSATFGQVIGKNPFLLAEYAKSILVDYSYKYFYSDRYGKAFQVYNLKKARTDTGYQQKLLTASFLSYCQQLFIFQKHQGDLSDFQIEKPLWAFVGSRVSGGKLESDVLIVVKFLQQIWGDPAFFPNTADNILSGKSGLFKMNGGESTPPDYSFLKNQEISPDMLCASLFQASGQLELYEIKNTEGEIGLTSSQANGYFGVINVGDVKALINLLAKNSIEVKADYLSGSLFGQINRHDSPIRILIGSKKFIEGWNSWRVSNMVLMNMGKGEGPQIIQLFGRGVRLKGQHFSLQRERNASNTLKHLQTLYIFGLNSDYMQAFLTAIGKEGLEQKNLLKIQEGFVTGGLATQKKPVPQKLNELKKCLPLSYNPEIAASLCVDIRPKITHISSENIAGKIFDKTPGASASLPGQILSLIDWGELYLEVIRFKSNQGMDFLIIEKDTIRKLFIDGLYQLRALPEQVEIKKYQDLKKIQRIAELIVQEYIYLFVNAHPTKHTEDSKEKI